VAFSFFDIFARQATMTSYAETEKYLFETLPMFQRVGPSAYKKDLKNTHALCEALGNPERKFKSVHIAGTNGKGSSSHMIASILQAAGYKTGLYTSPHLKSFTERIRINGAACDEAYVSDFVGRMRPKIEEIEPSFFELTTAMAFDRFAKEKVDIAVIEVGLGGRLDCTNVIQPEVSLITSIGYDHQQLLGDTLPRIASEKAGIMKKNIPVVISQTQAEVMAVFQNNAKAVGTSLTFADQVWRATLSGRRLAMEHNDGTSFEVPAFPLGGIYQEKNLPGVMETIEALRSLGWHIPHMAVVTGLTNVDQSTGLKGRWQQIGSSPTVICDTGHNLDGIRHVMQQILTMNFRKLIIIFGVVNDKDPMPVLQLLPTAAQYYFCEASIPRAMKAEELCRIAEPIGLKGTVVPNVNDAIAAARANAHADDLIFVGGSTFVVAEIDNL
jgi:dihydrofolate synthase/folylpolyglutamate synthase